MTTRRQLLRRFPAIILLVASPALAQRRDRIARIATLEDTHQESRGSAPYWAIFRKRLSELGHVEGKSYVIEARGARGETERLPALAAELVALKPDLIVTVTAPAALAAKNATSEIPIVAIGLPDPASTRVLRALRESARTLGIAVRAFDGRSPGNVERAFGAMAKDRVDGLIVAINTDILDNGPQIVAAAANQRIPTIYQRREYTDAGGLLSYGADLSALYRRAADYAHRILNGTRPAELPFELASTFQLAVNMKTAKALGLKVPQSVLVRANEVIQ